VHNGPINYLDIAAIKEKKMSSIMLCHLEPDIRDALSVIPLGCAKKRERVIFITLYNKEDLMMFKFHISVSFLLRLQLRRRRDGG
jgi:hypothetical protein